MVTVAVIIIIITFLLLGWSSSSQDLTWGQKHQSYVLLSQCQERPCDWGAFDHHKQINQKRPLRVLPRPLPLPNSSQWTSEFYSPSCLSKVKIQMVLPIEENLVEKAKELYECWSVKSFFWLSHAACGILVPWPGIEPGVVGVKARSPNHWTTREVPNFARFVQKIDLITEKVYLIQALYLFLLSTIHSIRQFCWSQRTMAISYSHSSYLF